MTASSPVSKQPVTSIPADLCTPAGNSSLTRRGHAVCATGGYTPAEQQRRERSRLEAAGRFACGDSVSQVAGTCGSADQHGDRSDPRGGALPARGRGGPEEQHHLCGHFWSRACSRHGVGDQRPDEHRDRHHPRGGRPGRCRGELEDQDRLRDQRQRRHGVDNQHTDEHRDHYHPVGTLAEPTGVALDPKTDTAYVANSNISTVPVLALCPK